MSNETTIGETHDLTKGRFIVLDGHPCKITNLTKSAPGKHGHAKSRIEAVSLFDGSKKGIVKPGDARVEIPIIQKKQANVLSVSGKSVQLMDLQSYETFDADIPEGMTFTAGETIFFWIVMGKKLLQRAD